MQGAAIRMTPQQIALVRESFAKVVPISEEVAALFYDRLFAIDPSTRPLFNGDMKSQGAKLMAAIERGGEVPRPHRDDARRSPGSCTAARPLRRAGRALCQRRRRSAVDARARARFRFHAGCAGLLGHRLWPPQRCHDRGLIGALARRGLVAVYRVGGQCIQR